MFYFYELVWRRLPSEVASGCLWGACCRRQTYTGNQAPTGYPTKELAEEVRQRAGARCGNPIDRGARKAGAPPAASPATRAATREVPPARTVRARTGYKLLTPDCRSVAYKGPICSARGMGKWVTTLAPADSDRWPEGC